MRDNAVYAQVEALRDRGTGPVLSPVALEIHVRAVDHSVHTPCPAFIADFDLIDHMSTSPTRRFLVAACRRVWRELNSERFIPL